MRHSLTWMASGLASVLLHFAVLAAVIAAVAPDEISRQPNPKTRLEIGRYEVDQVDTNSVTPNTDAIVARKGNFIAFGGAKIATAQASETTMTAQQVATAANEAIYSPATDLEHRKVKSVSNASLEGNPKSPIAATSSAVQSTRISINPVRPTVAKDLSEEIGADFQAVSDIAPRVNPTVERATYTKPVGEAQQAVLAWTGDSNARMDAQSLATVQAFMAPENPDASLASVGGVRDTLSGVLASLPCSRLQATFDPQFGGLRIVGHVPDPKQESTLLANLHYSIGPNIPVLTDLRILPAPQCAALAGISTLGLPQSSEHLTNPRVVGADTFAHVFDFREGDRLILDLKAPEYEAYIHIDYFDANGQVIHLVPNATVPAIRHTADSIVRIGDPTSEQTALDIRIAPPFGQEIAVALATSVPLYEAPRPLVEPAEPYLDWLRGRIAEARITEPHFKGEWAYFFVTTGP